MHTVHNPNPAGNPMDGEMFIASAMGIMFSVKDYDQSVTAEQIAIIDGFFGSLELTSFTNPKVKQSTYGDLMNMVNKENRWVYQGSVTTPPCAQKVYWNLLMTVYPIKQAHLDLFTA